MSEELIAADIRNARTLPSKFYYDEKAFNDSKTAFKGWQFALHSSQFKSNNIHPIEHIESITGEPIVIVKG
jgi:phenylpropionate dioxygenase-like ring-hydroxylating dioxygenase large terminal subunit